MKDAFSFEIQGIKELNQTIKQVVKSMDPDKVEPVLMKGAQTFARAARKKVPKGPTGNLRKAIRAKKLKRYGRNPAPAIAAVDRKRAPHAHLVEYGTGVRIAKRGKYKGRSFGVMPAQPFWRSAIDQNQDKVINKVIKDLKSLIEEAARK